MAFDVVKDIGPGFGPGAVMSPVNAFTLEQPEEALGRRIVGTATNSAHATDEVVTAQETLVFIAGELATAV